MKKNRSFFYNLALACLTSLILVSNAFGQNAKDLFWNLKLQNRNACARESQLPAQGFFIYVDGINFGRAAVKIATNNKQNLETTVQTAWTELHRSVLFVTQQAAAGLLSGSLPIVSKPEEVNAEKLTAVFKTSLAVTSSQQGLDQTCLQIKKSPSINFDTSKPTAKSLELLAQSFLNSNEFVGSCTDIRIHNSTESTLAMKWNLTADDSKLTFEFWESFKIYLSSAWKLGLFKVHAPKLGAWLQSYPLEEMSFMIADGCRSLSRPSCNSDFLSESQISSIISTPEFKSTAMLGRSFSDQIMPKEFISKNQSLTPIEDPTSFLKQLSRARQQSAQTLFESQSRLTAIFNQKSVDKLIADIEVALSTEGSDQAVTLAQFESACVENRVFTDSNLSAFATEIMANKSLVSKLEKMNFPGSAATENMNQTIDLSTRLQKICDQAKNKFGDSSLSAGSKSWMRSFFSSVLSAEVVNKYLMPAQITTSGNYLAVGSNVVCADPIDCWRTAIDSAARLYQVSLSSNILQSQGEVSSSNMGLNEASQVACKVYDPWAASNQKFKKLLLDTASAVAIAFVPVPLFLDITPSMPKVASFKQLVDEDKLKLEPIFWHEGWKKTLFADLGSLVGAPCTISISGQGSGDSVGADQSLIYKGFSAGTCAKKTNLQTDQNSHSVTQAKGERESVCGSCSISFQSVSSIVAKKGFGLIGAGLKMISAISKFIGAGKDPSLNAKTRAFDVLKVVEAYKMYGSIPDRCVKALSKGKPCRIKTVNQDQE